nr:DEAD/DEAH box helicase [Aquimarina sp. U1-2]
MNVSNPPKLHFEVSQETDYMKVQAFARIKGVSIPLQSVDIAIKAPFLEKDGVFYLLKSVGDVKAFETFKKNAQLRVPRNEFNTYYTDFLNPLSKKFTVDMQHLPTKTRIIPETEVAKQLYLSEIHGFILLKPIVLYAEEPVEICNPAPVQKLKKDHIEVLQRHHAYEEEFKKMLVGLHPEFAHQHQEFFHLTPKQFIENMWFLKAFELLKENDVQVFGYNDLSVKKYSLHKPSIQMNINSGVDWFDVNVKVAFGDLTVSLQDLQKSVINKNKYIALDDGSIGILPEHWLEKYAHLFRTATVKKEGIRVSKYQFSVIDSLYDDLDPESPILAQHRNIKERLQQFDKISSVTIPKGILATLRDYQKEGLNWLCFLDEYNFGGCLADDMGLGKTLQVITFLKHINTKNKPKRAHLVIVPTSLIFNWQEEIKKFCPSLHVIVHTGSEREKDTGSFKEKLVILTTYGIVMRDIQMLKNYDFHYIILDESQAIKNPNSQRYKAVRLLKAKNRLVLTGTPIENNTFDLYAQMSFANPGLLGTMAHFKKAFSIPIDKDKDSNVAKELKTLIHPFLLRRTKEQVAKELPEKTEQILYCTMSESQQQVYDAYRNKYRNYLLGKIDENGLGKTKIYVLEGLTKLRQICDAPQLLKEDEGYTSEAVKIKELLQHITEKTGKHKILIFSQFVAMLNLLKKELDTQGILYEYLDGKTKNRQERVANFQQNENIRLFLISLKAGGTGLNLTAADYVYIVDPWWNPAVEAQAIDRCYRIGQTKHVMAYKMICKGTIEEKIINYQARKKELSSDIIQTDESFVKSLSKASILELFS